MQDYWNNHLYKKSKGIQIKEAKAIDDSIRFELIIRMNELGIEYQHLFSYTTVNTLAHNVNQKAQQLDRVWVGRDRVRSCEGFGK